MNIKKSILIVMIHTHFLSKGQLVYLKIKYNMTLKEYMYMSERIFMIFCSVVSLPLLLNYCFCTVVLVPLFLYRCFCTFVSVPLFEFCCFCTVVSVLLFLYRGFCTVKYVSLFLYCFPVLLFLDCSRH